MRKVLGAVCLVLLLTGCGGVPGDNGFEKDWKALYPNANMTTAIPDAKAVCDSFKAGTKYQDEVAYLSAKLKAADSDSRNMIATATVNYCPDYKNLH